MKKSLIIFLSIILVVSSLCYVNASDLTYKKGSIIDIKIPCINNGSSCSGGATCSLTINDPDGLNVVKDGSMTNNLQYFNYTLDSNQTQKLGIYQYLALCQDSSINGYSIDNFEITSTGASNEFLNDIALFIFIIFAVILFILGLNKEDVWITLLSSFLFIIAGFWTYYNPIFYFPSFINLGLALVLWGFGVYILLRTAYELANTG